MEENINQIFEIEDQNNVNEKSEQVQKNDSYLKGIVINIAISIPLAVILVLYLYYYYQDKASYVHGLGALGVALAFIATSVTAIIGSLFSISLINMIIFYIKKYKKAMISNFIIFIITIIAAFIFIKSCTNIDIL